MEFEGLMIVSNGRRHQEVFNGSVLSEFCSERFRSSAVALSEESGPSRAASLSPPPIRGCWCKPQPGQLQDSGHSALVRVRSGAGFDLVAEDEVGAGVVGLGV